jgi:hypothetical protein
MATQAKIDAMARELADARSREAKIREELRDLAKTYRQDRANLEKRLARIEAALAADMAPSQSPAPRKSA